ncbi:hypothetical protein [Sedimenticola hydrogenitrophicus]|uniref:hypothetical protein n=1 Tax=Sedimenticola hydrogenitrophicus TaxID=2967975 RepID=UPI0021A76358|nr:hypothetical protein [Sedimenticola hydrogenitrophicus]
MKIHVLLASMLSLLLAGCSDSEDKPMPVENTVYGTQLKAIDKARGVEETINQSAKERDKLIKNQGG